MASSSSIPSSKVDSILPPSPSSLSASSISSHYPSSNQEDEDNITITRSLMKKDGKQRSQEAYAVFPEIQELRHKSQSSADTTSTANVIDQSLMNLDEKLDNVEKGMKSIDESLDPLLQSTPTLQSDDNPNGDAILLRKRATLQTEWETIRNESDVLREELKEDKWLTVFRTVTDQADGMMSSLEKAVNRCQDFIWQIHRRGVDDPHQLQTSLPTGQRNDYQPTLTLEVFASLSDSFEAKKKHYMPATSKVLAIIDRGVHDRVTKNGETLRRHAESAQRWKNLRERIARTDVEMENARQLLVSGEATPSEVGSSTSAKNGYLATPSNGSRASSSASTLSSSISPLRKFARKITRTNRPPPVTPLSINKNNGKREPTPEPVPAYHQQKTSFFSSMRGSQPTTPITPDRTGHKYSQSLTPDSLPHVKADSSTVKLRVTPPIKQRWNSSTKVEPEPGSKGTPPKRPPSAAGTYAAQADIPPVPPLGAAYRRSFSRASMISSRPWSPVTSTSTTQSSQPTHFPIFRPASRAQTPAGSRGVTPGLGTTPRRRPKTPSHIPRPSKQLHTSSSRLDNSEDDDSPELQRALSPTMSVTSSGFMGHPPRPPSRSMIPVPNLQFSTPSRPSSSMSFRSSATRAQTPESTLRANVQRITLFSGTPGRKAVRPSGATKLPPSSFKDSTASRAPSRPGSRIGAYTPNPENLIMHEYVPSNPKDPLDAEIAAIANSTTHGLLIERLDPPLKTIPKPGEEVKARYAFTNTLSRKELTLRLTTLTRPGKGTDDTTSTKRVMCRVGGGR
ncbi:hypothetical protein C0992_002630 [Termitomyces sp. T32_za158]|nr:hypothetical protein C0992_002630 [Termitomyces sp. T32_za158]